MTKKRKVDYSALLREQQTGATPETPAAPSADTARVPDASAPSAPASVAAEVHPSPEPKDVPAQAPTDPAASPPSSDAPTARARRRAADRASSPVDLASALNERATFERKRRGETPVPAVPAIGEPPSALGARLSAGTSGRPGAPLPPEAEAESREPSAESTIAADVASPAERPSAALAALSGDTMEFAVTSVALAIPFRERARARSGSAELLLFRIGRELFATALSAVEEAVELTDIRPLPEMSSAMLGVFDLRGRMIPIYTPSTALGVALAASPQAALVVRSGDRRMALAVDDVEDVLEVDLATVRAAPGSDDSDGVLLGVVRQGHTLVALLDGEALVNACLSDRVPETA